MEARDQSGKTANRREEGKEDRQRTAGDERGGWGMRGRGTRRRMARRDRPRVRARWQTQGRSARSTRVARAANEARSGDVAPLDPLLSSIRGPRVDARREGKDHAPRDAARKDAAGAATLALIVKVAILFQVATERGAAAKNDARWGALA